MSQPLETALELRAPQRLFFALWPDAGLGERLQALARELLPVRRGRWLAAERLHLTLAFLGEVSAAQRACLEQAAGRVRAAAFTLVIDRFDCFRRSGILWAGTTQVPQALRALVENLNEGMRGCGLAPDEREFHPHVTLARKLPRCPPPQPIAPPLRWNVKRFCLVRSETLPSGARYEILRSWALMAGTRNETRATRDT